MKLRETLLDLLFPPKCAFCARVIRPGGSGICADCFKALPRTGAQCRKKGDYFTLCVAPLYYEDFVRESLLRFKFGGGRSSARAYALLMAACIEKEFLAGYDILSWVPVSRRRLRQRGYDQAQLLAQELGPLLGMEPACVLEKVRHVPAQSGMGSAEKRRANISGAYRVLSPKKLEDKRILLVDDIVTTGSTFSECSKTLLRAGARQVLCAAVARDRD